MSNWIAWDILLVLITVAGNLCNKCPKWLLEQKSSYSDYFNAISGLYRTAEPQEALWHKGGNGRCFRLMSTYYGGLVNNTTLVFHFLFNNNISLKPRGSRNYCLNIIKISITTYAGVIWTPVPIFITNNVITGNGINTKTTSENGLCVFKVAPIDLTPVSVV